MLGRFLCVLVVFASVSPAAQAPARVSGLVLDPTGASVAAARVTIEVGGRVVAATDTASDGSFEISGVPPGKATVRVVAPGFAEAVLRLPNAGSPGSGLRVLLRPAGVFEAVTVSASGDEELAVPAASTVLTEAELAVQAAGAVDDVLRNTTGFGLTRRSSSRVSNPSAQGVTMRGLTGNAGSRTLVLADGLPLNDPFGGWVYWNRIPEAAIRRIEVVRGAAGDIYGGEAIGGVVQLLTFDPREPRLRAITEAGTEGTARASLFGAASRGGWSGSVGAELVRTDGQIVVARAERGPVDVAAFSNYTTGVAALAFERAALRLGARASVYQEDRGNGTPLVTNDTNWRLFSASGEGTLGGGTWSAGASAGRQRYFNNFSTVTPDRRTERVTREQRVPSGFAAVTAQWVRSWGAAALLLGGEGKWTDAEVRETRFLPGGAREFSVTGGTERVAGLYARALLTPAPPLTVAAGVRGDFWGSEPLDASAPSHAVNFFSPRVSLSWRLSPAIALRVSATRGHRTPTLDELHRAFAIGNTLTLGNPLLEPERLRAFDAGVAAGVGRLSGRATFFWNDLAGAVSNVTIDTEGGRVIRQKQNAESVRARGLELEGDFQPAAAFRVSAGLALTASRYREVRGQPFLEGLRVPQVPAVLANASLAWDDPRIATLSVQWRASSAQFEDDRNTRRLDAYSVFDLQVSRALTGRLRAYAACENLFDTEYQTGKTGTPPLTRVGWGRSLRFGLFVSLD